MDGLGGGICTTYLEVKISGSSFTRNKAIVLGGALYQTGNAFIIRKSIFNSNLVSGKLGQGGAVYTQGLFFHPTYLFVGNISDCLFFFKEIMPLFVVVQLWLLQTDFLS